MSMFVKNVERDTFEEEFQKSLKIKKNMLSLKGNPREKSSKDKGKTKVTVSKPLEDNKIMIPWIWNPSRELSRNSPMNWYI
jgi:hypothetical protein